jgi:hypothetical protein
LFLLATSNQGLAEAMEHIEHHLLDTRYTVEADLEPTARLVVRNAVAAGQDGDTYYQLRTAPVEHVARIPAWQPAAGAGAQLVKSRLAGLRGLLMRLGSSGV